MILEEEKGSSLTNDCALSDLTLSPSVALKSMPSAVADTSVLVAFSAVRRLDVLRDRYHRILIPPAVFRELVTDGENWTEATDAQTAIRAGSWIEVVTPHYQTFPRAGQQLPLPLGAGEREAILLADELGLTLLVDDALARRSALARRIAVKGTLGVLADAKRAGTISTVKPLVLALVAAGRCLDEELQRWFLTEMRED